MIFIRCFEPLIKGHFKTRAELGRVFFVQGSLLGVVAGKKEAKS